MNEVTVKREPSVIQDMADRFGMNKEAFTAALKATVVPANTSDAQFAAFCLVAKQYNLNPITKEIYAFPSKAGGIQPIVGIDGWCNIINSNPQLDGIEFQDHMADGKITAITCRISRKDRSKPTECTEYLAECERSTEPWKKWPARMLRHKALIQCARYAFSLSGILDQDEAERMEMIDVTPPVTDPNTGELVKATRSQFRTAAERKQFCENVKKSYAEAGSADDLALIRELNKPRFDAMQVSSNEHDHIGLEDLNLAYAMAEKRVAVLPGLPREGSDADIARMRGFPEESEAQADRIPEHALPEALRKSSAA